MLGLDWTKALPKIWILSGLTQPESNFRWRNTFLYYALLMKNLVKNGQKYVKTSGPGPTWAQNGHNQTRPGPEKKWPNPALVFVRAGLS